MANGIDNASPLIQVWGTRPLTLNWRKEADGAPIVQKNGKVVAGLLPQRDWVKNGDIPVSDALAILLLGGARVSCPYVFAEPREGTSYSFRSFGSEGDVFQVACDTCGHRKVYNISELPSNFTHPHVTYMKTERKEGYLFRAVLEDGVLVEASDDCRKMLVFWRYSLPRTIFGMHRNEARAFFPRATLIADKGNHLLLQQEN